MTGKWHPSTNQNKLVSELQILSQAHRNAGFIVLLERDSQLSVAISPESLDNVECIYTFYFFEISDDFKLKNICPPKEIPQVEFSSDVFYLQKNKNGYLALAVPKFQHFEAEFKMIFKSDQRLGQIKPSHAGICSFSWMKTFTGQFRQFQGGTPHMSSFYLNRGFVIFISEEANETDLQIFIELTVEGVPRNDKLCLYFLPLQMPLKHFIMQPDDFIDALYSERLTRNYNHFHAKIKPGYYLIVPTTKETLHYLSDFAYSLRVFCTSQFVLSRNYKFDFNKIVKREIKLQQDVSFQLKIKEKEQLMVLVEGNEFTSKNGEKILLEIGELRI